MSELKSKERPILFNAEMVIAILDGRKTQTRRIVKGIALDWLEGAKFTPEYVALAENDMCPFGKIGDQLWVRETTAIDDESCETVVLGRYTADGATVLYSRCDDSEYNGSAVHWWYGKDCCPSIHMPRWASRIQLEITSVHVERLNEISEADAKAEGMIYTEYGYTCFHNGAPGDVGDCSAPDSHHQNRPGWSYKPTSHQDQCVSTAKYAFQSLWSEINGADSWAETPWVWVIEFKRINHAHAANQ